MITRFPQRGAAILALSLVSTLALPLMAAEAPPKAGPKGLAYVSNQEGDVSVIDLATMETVGEISPAAKGPRGIGVSGDGRFLVTANRSDGNISIVDRVSGKLVRHVPIGENPEFVRVRGQRAFVSFEPESEGGPPPKPGSPEAIALEKQREEEETEPAQIAIVDLDKGKVIRNIVGGVETEGIEFSADGKNILITNEAEDSISIHNIETGKRIKTIDTKTLGKRPRGIKMAPDGKSYIATLEFANKLLLINDKFEPVKTVDTGKIPYGVAFDSKGEKLFVALAHGKALEVFDAKTLQSLKQIPTGERCWHFTFTPDESHILVACGRSHEVVVIDTATLAEVKRIEDKKLPWGIVTWPKSLGSLDVP